MICWVHRERWAGLGWSGLVRVTAHQAPAQPAQTSLSAVTVTVPYLEPWWSAGSRLLVTAAVVIRWVLVVGQLPPLPREGVRASCWVQVLVSAAGSDGRWLAVDPVQLDPSPMLTCPGYDLGKDQQRNHRLIIGG